MSKKEKSPLRVASEVYARIKYDDSMDESKYLIAFKDRFLGIVEKSMLEFYDIEDDIPWHRVYYFEEMTDFGRRRIWDRDTRFDAVFRSGNGDTPPKDGFPRKADVPFGQSEGRNKPEDKGRKNKRGNKRAGKQTLKFEDGCACRFDSDTHQWRIQSASAVGTGVSKGSYTIMSFNVLDDGGNDAVLHHRDRYLHLLSKLMERDADIVCLQEVSNNLLQMLMDNVWVRDNYYCSYQLPAPQLEPFGQVLFCKYPFSTVYNYSFSAQKHFQVCQLLINGRRTTVVSVHLTSNYRGDSSAKRQTQVRAIVETLQEINAFIDGDCYIVGDTNIESEDEDCIHTLTKAGFVDEWTAVHPDQAGITYDTDNNPCASIVSTRSHQHRYDRIFVRRCPHASVTLSSSSIDIFGQELLKTDHRDPLCISDHYGIHACFTCSNGEGNIDDGYQVRRPKILPLSKKTAVVVVPPHKQWDSIQIIRARHDRNYKPWMPHLSLLQGFIGKSHFQDAADAFTRVLSTLSSFRITLRKFNFFRIRSGFNVYLVPECDPPEAINKLQAVLQSEYPFCTEQSSYCDEGYVPHMSVAQFRTITDAKLHIAEWEKTFEPISFIVRGIYIVAREGDRPYEVHHKLPLESKEGDDNETTQTASKRKRFNFTNSSQLTYTFEDIEEDDPTIQNVLQAFVKPKIEFDELLNTLNDVCRSSLVALSSEDECLQTVCLPMGSVQLDCALKGSDLDVVCLGPTSINAGNFFEYLKDTLLRRDIEIYNLRIITKTAVPVMSFDLGKTSIDLSFVHYSHVDEPSLLSLMCPISSEETAVVNYSLLDEISPAHRLILTGLIDNHMIATQTARDPLFLDFVRFIRLWAQCNCIYGNMYGFIGGISWTIMCTNVFCNSNEDEKTMDSLLARFFSYYSEFDWNSRAVTIDGDVALSQDAMEEEDRAAMFILTPSIRTKDSTPEQNNSARNVYDSGKAIIIESMKQARSLIAASLTNCAAPDLPLYPSLLQSTFLSQDKAYYLLSCSCSRSSQVLDIRGMLSSSALGISRDSYRLSDSKMAVHLYPGSFYNVSVVKDQVNDRHIVSVLFAISNFDEEIFDRCKSNFQNKYLQWKEKLHVGSLRWDPLDVRTSSFLLH